MRRKRNYAAEYRRRLEHGKARGLTRSEARGHPRAGERSQQVRPPDRKDRKKLEAAFSGMQAGKSLTAAARSEGISPERLRRFVKVNELAERKGRTWVIAPKKQWRIPIIVEAETRAIIVPYKSDASDVSRYHNAVKRAVNSGDFAHVSPFKDKRVVDVSGRSYAFEADPNELYRYAAKDELQFHEIYQVVEV